MKPWEPRHLVSLGKLYEKEGLTQRAQRMYDQVRTMDPDFRFDADADAESEATAEQKK